jgi:hypothetical protein
MPARAEIAPSRSDDRTDVPVVPNRDVNVYDRGSLHMSFTRTTIAAIAALAVSSLLVAGALASSNKPSLEPSASMPASMPGMRMAPAAAMTAADLRVLLDRQLGEHAALAMNATNAGIIGSPAFGAIAKQLDANSVALSKTIASVYGAPAGNTFLNGKFMWRDHIRFFVAYTVALAKHDRAGQAKAVANLKTYTVKFGDFLAGATGLPAADLKSDLLVHVLELKGQLDLFAGHKYAKAEALYHDSYTHMFMTGDLLAGAIAKQKGLS